MKNASGLLLFWISISCGLPLAAQVDTLHLDTVSVTARRLAWLGTGYHISQVDSLQLIPSASLADVLGDFSQGFIKLYGPGALATPGLRGTAAAHTAVIWEGLNLQSPLNGTVDLSLFPASLMGEVWVQPGGSPALGGSGSLGGVIHLGAGPDPAVPLQAAVHLGTGSFGFWHGGGRLSLRTSQITHHLRYSYRRADNNFAYARTDLPGMPIIRQAHAAYVQQGAVYDMRWQPAASHAIEGHLWLQASDRQLPRTAWQADAHLRAALAWHYTGTRLRTSLRGGYLHETLQYRDTVAGIFSENMARTWQLSGEGTYRLHHRHSILGSAQGQWIQALATGYGRLRPEQARTLAQVSMRSGWQHERLVTLLTLRMEAITRPQWMPSAGITWQAHPALRLRGYVARTYRYPSFNDLYWSPGGQPDLKPETGWTAEAGWSYVCRPGNTILTLHQGVFSHHIQNWILWRPGTGYWSAENVLQVWSRGLESSLHWQRPAGRWVPVCVVWHHLVRATRTAIYDGADATLHKQLIYTPVHQASVRVGISHRGYTLSYTQAYVGRRYTTADNTLFLSPFTLGSTALSRNFERRYVRGSLTLRAENLWQATYQVVAGYPMPRQQVHLDLSLSPVFAEAKP